MTLEMLISITVTLHLIITGIALVSLIMFIVTVFSKKRYGESSHSAEIGYKTLFLIVITAVAPVIPLVLQLFIDDFMAVYVGIVLSSTVICIIMIFNLIEYVITK